MHVYSVSAHSTDTGGDRQGHDRQGRTQLSTSGTYKCLQKHIQCILLYMSIQ